MSIYEGRVLYIFNGIVSNDGIIGVSGGDLRLFEIIKRNTRLNSHVFTTTNGVELLNKFNIKVNHKYILAYQVTSGAISNLRVAYEALMFIPPDLKKFRGYVYSSCEHLYDVLPALRLKITNKCKWYAVYHWVEDYPWKEKRGNTPWFNRYLYWLNRVVTGLLIKHFADTILAVSDQTKEKLIKIKKVNPIKIKSVYCGVNYQDIQRVTKKYIAQKGSKYDAIFMKRLNYGKGVLDLLDIWKICCEKNPDLRLGIIGDGPVSVVDNMKTFIRRNHLEKNIDFIGVVYDFEEKYRLLNSSKLFILPTHEENWAIVIGEAMATGLPVISYRLKEIEPIWQNYATWINLGDTRGFASKIIHLISSPLERYELQERARLFVQKYDWEEIAKNEFE